jgi:hypothetical protein
MKKFLKLKRIWLLLCYPLAGGIHFAAAWNQNIAEYVFARGIYPFVSVILNKITGIFPFSLMEVLIVAFPFFVLFIIISFILFLIRKKENKKEKVEKGILNIFCICGVVLLWFTVLCNTNYYRYSFTYYSGLTVKPATPEELYGLCESLLERTNEVRGKIKEDEDGTAIMDMSYSEMAEEARRAYLALSEEYEVLKGDYGKPKFVSFSKMMSRLEITGIYCPFTMEANVNIDIPVYTVPDTMCHELAHLRGFMREEEANFLGYLACQKSASEEFQYSGLFSALIQSMNQLYSADREKYMELRIQYSEGLARDMEVNNQYWDQYEDTVISAVSDAVNDTYLKANSQFDGVKSYGRMVDLLIAEYRKSLESK